jgi:hypothetical protein
MKYQFRRFGLLMCVIWLCTACASSATSNDVVSDDAMSGGGISPEVAVESFLNDLNTALKDPELNRADVRDQWAETLANYFVPVERAAQQTAIRASLESLSRGVTQLDADEKVEFTITFEPARRIREDQDKVFVEVPNAKLAMLINRTSNRGNVVIWQQEESLGYLIGSNENVFPVVRVGVRWFLSES